MTTQYFKVRNGLSVGEDAVTIDAATGNVVATGDVTLKDTVTIQGATSGSVALSAPGVAGSQAYTLPTGLPGVSGYVLASNTGGVMSWVANSDTNTTYTVDASTTTGGANFNLVGSDASTDTIKFANGTNVTVTATDANTITIAATDTNTTYTIDASSTTGGANLNLVGSDSSTDTVKIASGTGVTVAQVSANELSVAIGQAVGTGDSPAFAGVTGGNISVGVATDNTIASTDTNGDIILDPNGTGEIILSSVVRAQGEIQATTNLNYTFPPQTLMTVSDNNGYSAASSMPANSNGYGANATFTHYFADTLAGNNTTGAFIFRTANGNSTTDTVPFTGIAGVAPSATLSTNTLGTLNFNGYGTTGFTNDVATTNQGGGINALHLMQAQSYATENFSDSTLTLTSTNVTAVASSVAALISGTAVTGTKGQFSCTSTTLVVGQAVRITGTLTGTATGIAAGDYWIIVTNGTTTFTLAATPGGNPIDTTAGTTTGLTFRRCSVTFTTTGLTSVPFGRGAKVAVSGVNNTTAGTYPVVGTPTLTSVQIGIPWTSGSTPTVSGSQSFSCLTVYGSSGLRVRSFPASTPVNIQNRLEMLDMSPAATTVRTNLLTLNTGAYGNTGVGITGNNIVYNRVYGQWQYDATITPAAANTAYAYPIAGASGVTDFANIASVGSTSRIIPGAAGMYKLQFSVQLNNADNGNDHIGYFWWRKNGTDVPNSTGQVTVVKSSATIAGWDNMISSANTTDYWELMYAVSNTSITLPYYAATAFAPAAASMFITLVPIGA